MNKNNLTKEILNKVPQITIFFWIIKILCTTVGETFADFINFNLGLGLTITTIIMGVGLMCALIIQLRATQYIPSVYWITVVLLSVFGTLVTDNLTDNLSVPLEISTIVFSILLALTFLGWYLSEKTLSIHSVYTVRREVFYWLTILFTFALGTAVGDLYSEQLGFGYFYTGLGVSIIIAIIYLANKFAKLNHILAFWIAYILTRPLGASLGDLLSQPKANGGLGLGTTITSIIFLIAILGTIIYLGVSKVDRNKQSESITFNSKKQRNALLQTIIVIILTIIAGIGSYEMRMASIASGSQTSLKDQLTQFKDIETKLNNYSLKGDYTNAKAEADKLEKAWDSKEPKLRAIDSNGWTKVDVTIDGVLTNSRDSSPDKSKISNVVKISQKVIDSLNK